MHGKFKERYQSSSLRAHPSKSSFTKGRGAYVRKIATVNENGEIEIIDYSKQSLDRMEKKSEKVG